MEDDMLITTHLYMTISNKDELDIYVRYLAYRVQRDLYEVCREKGRLREMSWGNFVYAVRRCKWIRDVAAVAAKETIKNSYARTAFVLTWRKWSCSVTAISTT